MPRYNYPGYGPTLEGWLGARPGTKGGYHGGTDSPAEAGTPVYSEHDGEIFRSGRINGYGMSVIVKSVAPDGTPFYELYGHLGPDPLPTPKTTVKAGERIPGAVIGTTKYVRSMGGKTTGPHLHREVISGKAQLNREGPLGIVSSDIRPKADPDTFDINHPVFPYEDERVPLPPPQIKDGAGVLPTSPPSLPPLSGQKPAPRPGSEDAISPPLFPGMAIPGAEYPTSIGGPAGPTPLVPPVLPRLQGPGGTRSNPGAPSPLNFVPQPRQNFGLVDPAVTSRSGGSVNVPDWQSSTRAGHQRPMPDANASASSPGSAENAAGRRFGGIFAPAYAVAPSLWPSAELPSQFDAVGDIRISRPGQRRQVPVMPSRPGYFASPFPGAFQGGAGDLARLFGSVPRAGPLDQMQPATLPRGEGMVKPMPFIGGLLPKPPPYSPQPNAPFPLEALLAPDRDKALDEWSSVPRRRQVAPTTPAMPDAGGSIADLIMSYIRSRKGPDGDQLQQPGFSTDAAPMPLVHPYDVFPANEEYGIDDPRQDPSSIRRLSRVRSL